MSIILKAVDIEKTYGKGDLQVEALKPSNLEIEEGIFYAKTSCYNLILQQLAYSYISFEMI